MSEAHAAKHVRCLRELDVVVADDFDPISPWVEKIEKRPGQRLDSRSRQCLPHALFVVDDEPKMPSVVGRLPTTFLKRNELIAKINERHRVAPATKRDI